MVGRESKLKRNNLPDLWKDIRCIARNERCLRNTVEGQKNVLITDQKNGPPPPSFISAFIPSHHQQFCDIHMWHHDLHTPNKAVVAEVWYAMYTDETTRLARSPGSWKHQPGNNHFLHEINQPTALLIWSSPISNSLINQNQSIDTICHQPTV